MGPSTYIPISIDPNLPFIRLVVCKLPFWRMKFVECVIQNCVRGTK